MKNIHLLIIVLVLTLIDVIISSSNTTFFNTIPNIKVKINDNDIASINIEDYVIGVVAGEMPASFQDEALKAQAVAARTYAIFKMQNNSKNYDVVTSVANQRYLTIDEMKSKWNSDFNRYYEKIKNAVNETVGEVMFYNDEIVEAYYFSMSNGYTEDVSLVFSENKDYLQSVESNYEVNNKNFLVTKDFSKEDFCNKLNINCNKIDIKNIIRSSTSRVNYITINDITFKGTEFRHKLGLRSTDFTINLLDNVVRITTKGYGHGVGMSQYGANGMAKEGYSYDEILKYYYKNINISSI